MSALRTVLQYWKNMIAPGRYYAPPQSRHSHATEAMLFSDFVKYITATLTLFTEWNTAIYGITNAANLVPSDLCSLPWPAHVHAKLYLSSATQAKHNMTAVAVLELTRYLLLGRLFSACFPEPVVMSGVETLLQEMKHSACKNAMKTLVGMQRPEVVSFICKVTHCLKKCGD